MGIKQIKFLINEAEETCPRCGMRLFDSEVCDYCHWRRYKKGPNDETLI
jgi:RNA polymerase subunit RPABC4/transcription elongation factor Spt4